MTGIPSMIWVIIIASTVLPILLVFLIQRGTGGGSMVIMGGQVITRSAAPMAGGTYTDALGNQINQTAPAAPVAMYLPQFSDPSTGALLGGVDPQSFYLQRVGGALWGEVEEIKTHDPAFDIRVFADQATTAFLTVQRAFAEQDAGAARRVLTGPLWEQARTQIEEYRRNHKRNIQEKLSVHQTRFLGSHSRNGYDTVGLRIFTSLIDYDVDANTGAVVRGDKVEHPVAVDTMFQRSATAVTKAEGGTLTERCPNCGAPLKLDWDGSCTYCQADVMSGDFDWVLCKIIQLNDWNQALASAPPDILAK